ncbi:phosphoribosylformylglycinamidine cyclo-ligase [Stigmatella aurantiaca DW4/3-1]|uniref:Phosphoribosylformylglycinamidine cyclo-ligase n=1 Tax=Stigmatella aurantiaca (strain DW4/3-1) TaxID=378806 RepID=Q08ZV2_STIAD|nr:phosphoribosylformylglycinamidine cyclo-ligase [Stigmatella aurantiaca DW4/3-1]
MTSEDFQLHLEVSELPLHLQILEEVVQPGRVVHDEAVTLAFDEARALQAVEHETDGGLAHAELLRQLARVEVHLDALFHGASPGLAGVENLVHHPAGGIRVHQVLDLGGHLREPLGQLLDHPHGDLGVAADHRLEGLRVDDQQLRVLRHRGGGVARLVGDDGHLPEELARPQHRQVLFHLAHLLRDGDLPGLQDEHVLARLALLEEDRALGEFLSEPLKKGFLGAHLNSESSSPHRWGQISLLARQTGGLAGRSPAVTTYKQSGVDIEAGDAFVERIKPYAARTVRPEVVSGVGGFGGLFALPPGKYREPVLVSGTDGVGTKLKVAFLAGRHGTVGIDLVAMSVNDILTCGAEPLFFLDYFATSRLEVDAASEVVKGIALGCEQAGCTLLGGETAEMPGFYGRGEYDLAGFCVGVVERSEIIDGRSIAPGDVVLGLPSSGLHSNGYSLARKVLLDDRKLALEATPEGLDRPLAEALLEPTRIYVKDIQALLKVVKVKGMAHITGSGIPGNLPRCLPDGTRAVLSEKAWARPALFDVIARLGGVPRDEMFSTFNMGLGFTVVVAKEDVDAALRTLNARGVKATAVGRVEQGSGEATAVIEP